MFAARVSRSVRPNLLDRFESTPKRPRKQLFTLTIRVITPISPLQFFLSANARTHGGKRGGTIHICVYKFCRKYDYLGLEIIVNISSSALSLLFL